MFTRRAGGWPLGAALLAETQERGLTLAAAGRSSGWGNDENVADFSHIEQLILQL